MAEMRNQYQNESADQKRKGKQFWKGFGIVCLSLFLAVLTVFVISL